MAPRKTMPQTEAVTETTDELASTLTELKPTFMELFTEIVMKPFPKEAIKQREGGRGAVFKYIEGQTAVRRFIEATNNEFSFEILDDELIPYGTTSNGAKRSLMKVSGRLYFNGFFRDNVGVQVITEGGGEDLYKGAVTDCFKRCCMMYGMALELYGDDYENPTVSDATRKEFARVWNELNADQRIEKMSDANTIAQKKFNKNFTELKESDVISWLAELKEATPTKAAF